MSLCHDLPMRIRSGAPSESQCSGAKCSFEGNKVLLFLDVTEAEALKWRKIDPHFRPPRSLAPHEAPCPAARFPADDDGWKTALWLAGHMPSIDESLDVHGNDVPGWSAAPKGRVKK